MGLTPEHLAYGSSTPPAPPVDLKVPWARQHRATVNRLAWMSVKISIRRACEVCCAKTSINFLDSLSELFGPLANGIKTVLLPSALTHNLEGLVLTLSRYCVTRLVLVPALLQGLFNLDVRSQVCLSGVKYYFTSGEALSCTLASTFLERLPKNKLINLYGSSEDGADVTCYELKSNAGVSSVPIGTPIANTQVYVLDERMEPVPM